MSPLTSTWLMLPFLLLGSSAVSSSEIISGELRGNVTLVRQVVSVSDGVHSMSGGGLAVPGSVALSRVWTDLNNLWEQHSGRHTMLRDKVWPPFVPDLKVLFATIFSYVGAAFSNAAGIGGGGLWVPMFNLLLGYDLKTSTALAKPMILGGAIASLCFNLQLRHPSKEGPLIDFGVARLIQPILLLGISIGVLCNVMFPPWLITILLCTFLTSMTSRTLQRALTMRKKELQAAAQRVAQPIQLAGPDAQRPAIGCSPAAPSSEADCQVAPAAESGGGASRSGSRTDLEEAVEESTAPEGQQGQGPLKEPLLPRHAPSKKKTLVERLGLGKAPEKPLTELINFWELGELVIVWVIYLVLQLSLLSFPLCSPGYWLLNLAQIPVSLVATGLAAWRMNSEHRRKVQEGESVGEDDHQWSITKVVIYPLYALMSGIMGGLLGIGGGTMMGVVLLELGLQPQVSAATSSFVVIFTSSLSTVEFYVLDRLPVDAAVYFGIVAMIAAFSGVFVIRSYVVKSGRASMIVFVLGLILAVSDLLLGTLGTVRIVDAWERGANMGFRNPCQKDW